MSDGKGAVDRAKDYLTPGDLPNWVNNPDTYIRERISAYLLGFVATILFAITGAIDSAFNAVTDAFGAAGESARSAAAAGGEPILTAIGTFQATIVDVSASFGPFGPLFVAVVYVTLIVVTARLIIAIADGIPVVQSVVTFFQR